MTALSLMLRPTATGWSVCMSNGRELVHYRGPFSKRLATRYLQHYVRDMTPRSLRLRPPR